MASSVSQDVSQGLNFVLQATFGLLAELARMRVGIAQALEVWPVIGEHVVCLQQQPDHLQVGQGECIPVQALRRLTQAADQSGKFVLQGHGLERK
ncbi:MAG: hypothetical protein JZU58_04815 [Curvibacter lanceolatus]|uniref:hypothetical protein n=1 Tax=Curvibacter lanceolatus TaxID=86182 RepID=UPI0012FA01BE|nr:hypothetical protein [Curvibacter lanceolatus]MBV5291652.1 hypothetical protein [Curvibacter lanceolatus]